MKTSKSHSKINWSAKIWGAMAPPAPPGTTGLIVVIRNQEDCLNKCLVFYGIQDNITSKFFVKFVYSERTTKLEAKSSRFKVLWPSRNVWTLWTNPETISKNWIATPCLACLPVWLFGVYFAFIKLKCCCWQLTSAKLRHNSSGPQCEIFLKSDSKHRKKILWGSFVWMISTSGTAM